MTLNEQVCAELKLTPGEAELLIQRRGVDDVAEALYTGVTSHLRRDIIVVKRLAKAMEKEGFSPNAAGMSAINEMLSPRDGVGDPLEPAIGVLLKPKI